MPTNIINSYSTGNVNGYHFGRRPAGNTTNVYHSWESGNVTGYQYVGGHNGGSRRKLTNSYELGNVTGMDTVGGIAGRVGMFTTISNSYSAGKVTGVTNVGGIVGTPNFWGNRIFNSHWNAADGLNATGAPSGRGTMNATYDNNNNYALDQDQMTLGDLDRYVSSPTPMDPGSPGNQSTASAPGNPEGYIPQETGSQYGAEPGRLEGSDVDFGGWAVAETVQQTGATPSRVTTGSASSASGPRQSSLDDHIVFGDSDTYSAHIKSININGVQMDLEDNSPDNTRQKK